MLQWRIQEFQNRGARLFGCPLTHTLCSCSQTENRLRIVHIVCSLQLNYMRVMQSNFTKTNHTNISIRGRAPSAPVLDPHLCYMYMTSFSIVQHRITYFVKQFYNNNFCQFSIYMYYTCYRDLYFSRFVCSQHMSCKCWNVCCVWYLIFRIRFFQWSIIFYLPL